MKIDRSVKPMADKTIADFLRENPDKTYSIKHYFINWCDKCGKEVLELDEEYSFDVTAADIGTTGYDWIFDFYIGKFIDDKVNIKGKVIEIIVRSVNDFICPECIENDIEELGD